MGGQTTRLAGGAARGRQDLVVGLVCAGEEETLGQEEAHAEVQVEVGVVVTDGAAQQEGGDGHGEAQQGDDQAHVAEDVQGGLHLSAERDATQGPMPPQAGRGTALTPGLGTSLAQSKRHAVCHHSWASFDTAPISTPICYQGKLSANYICSFGAKVPDVLQVLQAEVCVKVWKGSMEADTRSEPRLDSAFQLSRRSFRECGVA